MDLNIIILRSDENHSLLSNDNAQFIVLIIEPDKRILINGRGYIRILQIAFKA
jgi:hypothetical protein